MVIERPFDNEISVCDYCLGFLSRHYIRHGLILGGLLTLFLCTTSIPGLLFKIGAAMVLVMMGFALLKLRYVYANQWGKSSKHFLIKYKNDEVVAVSDSLVKWPKQDEHIDHLYIPSKLVGRDSVAVYIDFDTRLVSCFGCLRWSIPVSISFRPKGAITWQELCDVVVRRGNETELFAYLNERFRQIIYPRQAQIDAYLQACQAENKSESNILAGLIELLKITQTDFGFTSAMSLAVELHDPEIVAISAPLTNT